MIFWVNGICSRLEYKVILGLLLLVVKNNYVIMRIGIVDLKGLIILIIV